MKHFFVSLCAGTLMAAAAPAQDLPADSPSDAPAAKQEESSPAEIRTPGENVAAEEIQVAKAQDAAVEDAKDGAAEGDDAVDQEEAEEAAAQELGVEDAPLEEVIAGEGVIDEGIADDIAEDTEGAEEGDDSGDADPDSPPPTSEEIDEILEGAAFTVEERFRQQVDLLWDKVAPYVSLDAARKARLEAAREATVAALVQDWKEKTRQEIPSWPSRRREQMRVGQVRPQIEAKVKDRPEWTEAWQTILTEEERRSVQEALTKARNRRVDALAKILIGEVDRHLRLDPPQREALAAAARPFIAKAEDFFFDPLPSNASHIDLSRLFLLIRDEDAVRGLLDDTQRRIWTDIPPNHLDRQRSYTSRQLAASLTLPEVTSSDEALRLLASILANMAVGEREKFQELLDSHVAAICRVTFPSPDVRQRLATLTKGTVDHLTRQSLSNLTSNAWNAVQDAPYQTWPERLSQAHVSTYMGNLSDANYLPALWTEGLKSILSPAQLAVLSAQDAAAEDWRHRAQAWVVLTEIEKAVFMPLMPREALREHLYQKIRHYHPIFDNTFSPGWTLRGYYACIPLEMIAFDEGLETYFSTEEIDRLRQGCLSQTQQFVDNIRENHAQTSSPPRFLRQP